MTKDKVIFNIFECGRNILNQLDVTYQRAFTASAAASPVQKGFYQISPAQERYYDIMADHIEEKNVGTIDKEELCKAIAHLKYEDEANHERNIDNMTQVDGYKSPWKNKDATDATTVNNALDDTGYTFLDSYQTDTSDSSKQVETSKYPIKDTQTIKDPIIDDTHIVDRCRYLQDGPTNMDPVLTGVGIIGQRGPRTISRGSISQSIIQGGESIIYINVITHVLTNSSKMTLKSDSFTFDSLKVQTLMITPLMEPFLTSDRDIRTTIVIGKSSPNHSRIGTPFMKKDISSGDNVLITVQSDIDKADKLDTAVQ